MPNYPRFGWRPLQSSNSCTGIMSWRAGWAESQKTLQSMWKFSYRFQTFSCEKVPGSDSAQHGRPANWVWSCSKSHLWVQTCRPHEHCSLSPGRQKDNFSFLSNCLYSTNFLLYLQLKSVVKSQADLGEYIRAEETLLWLFTNKFISFEASFPQYEYEYEYPLKGKFIHLF